MRRYKYFFKIKKSSFLNSTIGKARPGYIWYWVDPQVLENRKKLPHLKDLIIIKGPVFDRHSRNNQCFNWSVFRLF